MFFRLGDAWVTIIVSKHFYKRLFDLKLELDRLFNSVGFLGLSNLEVGGFNCKDCGAGLKGSADRCELVGGALGSGSIGEFGLGAIGLGSPSLGLVHADNNSGQAGGLVNPVRPGSPDPVSIVDSVEGFPSIANPFPRLQPKLASSSVLFTV